MDISFSSYAVEVGFPYALLGVSVSFQLLGGKWGEKLAFLSPAAAGAEHGLGSGFTEAVSAAASVALTYILKREIM